MSFRDRDEYRVGVDLFDILLGLLSAVRAIDEGHRTCALKRDVESGYQLGTSAIAVHTTSAVLG
jgi:hypothetical protein